MKEIEELKDRLRNEMVTRMDDSDIVDILTVLQRAEEEIETKSLQAHKNFSEN